MVATLVATRTVLLVDAAPAKKTLALLTYVESRRLSANLHPYNLIRFSFLSLGISCLILVWMRNGPDGVAVSGLLLSIIMVYFHQEDRIHTESLLLNLSSPELDVEFGQPYDGRTALQSRGGGRSLHSNLAL